MRSLAPIRFGLRAARRRLGLVLLVYLVGLVPAVLVGIEAAGDLSSALARSPFAAEALSGNRWGVWQDLRSDPAHDLSGAFAGLFGLSALGLLVHVLVAAGIVEVLLFREPRGEHPFLLGIGRHGWRFVRSAIWFGGAMLLVAALVGRGFDAVYELARDRADAGFQLAGWVVVLALALVVFVPLDLAYDLSRLAAAGHGDRRTLVGFFRALGHALRHPLRLTPLWLFFHLLAVGLLVGYVLARAAVAPANGLHVALVVAAQQVVFLLLAFLTVGRWGAEIAYYQAIGEPRWCGRRERHGERRERRGEREVVVVDEEAAGGGVGGEERVEAGAA